MPLDPSIYGQIRPFTMSDPLDSASKAMQFMQAKKQMDTQNAMEDAARASAGDPSQMPQHLMQAGQALPAMKIRSQLAAQQQKDIEGKLKIAEAASSDAIAMDAVYRDFLRQHNGDQAQATERMAPIYNTIRQKWALQGHQLPDQFNPDQNYASIGQAKELAQYLKQAHEDQRPEYGQPVPGIDEQGQQRLYRPEKRGGMLPTDVRPMPTKTDSVEAAAIKLSNKDFINNSWRPTLNAADSALRNNREIEALKSINFNTGWGRDAIAKAANAVASMAPILTPDQVRDYASNAQKFNKFVFDKNWEVLNLAKGVQTEGDSERALKTWVRISNTPDANNFIIDMTRATNAQAQAKAKFYRERRRAGGENQDMAKIEMDWMDSRDAQKSIFDFPSMKKWQQALGQSTGEWKVVR